MNTIETMQHSSRICTNRLPTVCISVAAISTPGDGGVRPQENKFEQICSEDHQVSVAGGGGIPMSQCIMGNGHMTTLPEQIDRQTPVKTLPSHNFTCWW